LAPKAFRSSEILAVNKTFRSLVGELNQAHQQVEWVKDSGNFGHGFENVPLQSPPSVSGVTSSGQGSYLETLEEDVTGILSELGLGVDGHELRALVKRKIEQRKEEIVKLEAAEREMENSLHFHSNNAIGMSLVDGTIAQAVVPGLVGPIAYVSPPFAEIENRNPRDGPPNHTEQLHSFEVLSISSS